MNIKDTAAVEKLWRVSFVISLTGIVCVALAPATGHDYGNVSKRLTGSEGQPFFVLKRLLKFRAVCGILNLY